MAHYFGSKALVMICAIEVNIMQERNAFGPVGFQTEGQRILSCLSNGPSSWKAEPSNVDLESAVSIKGRSLIPVLLINKITTFNLLHLYDGS